MKSKQGLWGFLFVGLLGVLFHFAYDFFGQNWVAGVFFPINESIWEHLKLLYYPVILWWGIEWFWGQKTPCFFPVRMKALALAVGAIPVLYYTYSGIVGQRFAVADIGIFFVAAALYFWLTARFSAREKRACEGAVLGALTALLILFFAFTAFTFFPPDLGIFCSP